MLTEGSVLHMVLQHSSNLHLQFSNHVFPTPYCYSCLVLKSKTSLNSSSLYSNFLDFLQLEP